MKTSSLWSNWLRNVISSTWSRRYRARPYRRWTHWTNSPMCGDVLESRNLLSTITVTSAADVAGAHSGITLRDAITQANASSGADTIVFNSSLNGTTFQLSQGQLSITDTVTIRGNGALSTIVDARGLSRVFEVSGSGTSVVFDGLTITGGKTTGSMQQGGGIRFNSSGSLAIQNSAVSGNSTTGSGSPGGAVYSTIGSITITNSTLSGNSTKGPISSGGALYAISGAVTITNSTVTGNSTAGTSSFGGGIASPFADITLRNSTLARNSTTGSFSSGGGIYSRIGQVTLSGSIVALNTIRDGGYPDIFTNFPLGGTVTADHSLLGNKQGTLLAYASESSPDANGNIIGTNNAPIDPRLGILANNGGSTQTLALLAGSPALGRGGSTTLLYDQRGNPFSRTADGGVDMGAVEYSGGTAPVLPTVSLAINSAAINEAAGQSTITATLSSVSALNTTVKLAFSGTATLSSDYTRSATQIVIPAGQLSGSITLTAVQDTIYESNESIVVAVDSVTNGIENQVQQVTATITSDDPLPSVTLSSSTASLSEVGGTSTITARLSAVSSTNTTVKLGFSGSARVGTDYTRSATQIVIPAGQLTGSVTIAAVNDALYEPNKTLNVGIGSVTNGVESGTQQVSLTIINDDPPPVVTLAINSGTGLLAGGQVLITARLSAVSGTNTTIKLAFTGTATLNSDYTRSAAQIVIPAGQLTGSITLTSIVDSLVEPRETIVLDISSVTNGVETGVQRVAAEITDQIPLNLLDKVYADLDAFT